MVTGEADNPQCERATSSAWGKMSHGITDGREDVTRIQKDALLLPDQREARAALSLLTLCTADSVCTERSRDAQRLMLAR